MDASVLKATPLFKDIDVEGLEALSQLVNETSLGRGDSLFREGDEGDHLYIVTDSKVKLSHSSNDGRESLIAVLDLGEIIGRLSLFNLGARSSTVTTIAPTHLISLAHKDMMNFINRHPDMAITMLRELTRRLRNTSGQMTDLVSSDTPGRVTKALIDLANHFRERAPGGTCVTHDLIQEELTHLVGASCGTVNELLTDLVSRGWIRPKERAMLLIEIGRLQRRAH